MAHIRSSSYHQDSHDDYASSSSSHRQPYHSLHLPKQERRGRPAYTTVRPFIIDSRDSPVARSHDTMTHDLNRHVGDYVADRLVPTMLRSSDRPVEVFMNFGDAKLTLPDTDPRPVHGLERNRSSSRVPNAIIYNAPGCSLTLDDRRCDRYCDHCEMVERDHRDRGRHHHHDHRRHREMDLDLDRRRHSRQPRSRSHIRVVSHSRNPSPSPLPLPGLFPIATAVEKATHSSRNQHRGVSHALCPGCLIKTTVYRDGYCTDCDPPRYSPSSSRRADVLPISSGTRVRYLRETDGSASDDSWARVEVNSRADRDKRRGRGRSMERPVKVYDVLTDNRGYGGDARRRGRSRWENERRLTPRFAGYASESDL